MVRSQTVVQNHRNENVGRQSVSSHPAVNRQRVFLRPGTAPSILTCPPQRSPSYMEVMLQVTDFVGFLPSPRRPHLNFILYNQPLAASASTGFHWHVSCHIPSCQEMVALQY